MRGKRSKQYRKLMHQYGLIFGFREPYQVLIDAQILEDADRFKMDLVGGLERTLHGKIKPMITQCSIRHLYSAEPKNERLILQAKEYERRRCDHHLLDKPLSTLECLRSVVDSKDNKTNKHRYVVATRDPEVRAFLRRIPGVPLIYINRSVMIMEPMGGATEELKQREERQKFKAGLKSRPNASTALGKRQRDEGESMDDMALQKLATVSTADVVSTKKRKKGPKGPNPLSVKKPKSRLQPTSDPNPPASLPTATPTSIAPEESNKKKRKRKHKPKTESAGAAPSED